VDRKVRLEVLLDQFLVLVRLLEEVVLLLLVVLLSELGLRLHLLELVQHQFLLVRVAELGQPLLLAHLRGCFFKFLSVAFPGFLSDHIRLVLWGLVFLGFLHLLCLDCFRCRQTLSLLLGLLL
jgi:hypothetical protein